MGYLPVADIETAVEDYYRTIQVHTARAEELRLLITEILNAARLEARGEADRLERRLKTIEDRRRKVLDAYVSGAIDQDLLAEQQKARHETADTERLLAAARINLGDLEGKILAAVALAANAEDVYRRSAPAMRRLYNQAFFQRLYITADGASEATLTEPFAALLEDDMLQRIHNEIVGTRRGGRSRSGRGADAGTPHKGTNAVGRATVELTAGRSDPGRKRTNPATTFCRQGSNSRRCPLDLCP